MTPYYCVVYKLNILFIFFFIIFDRSQPTNDDKYNHNCPEDRLPCNTMWEMLWQYFNIRMCEYHNNQFNTCLLYTSDAADDLIGVDGGGRRVLK